ncbi:MAG: hypothetical protein ACREE0_20550 [Phenylobacterium sp.]
MIAPVAQSIVPSLLRIEGLTPRVLQPLEMEAVLNGKPISSPRLAAAQVALAPAAMSALIEAQEHMAGDATPTDRNVTAQKIDNLLARLTDTPPAQPVAPAAQGDVSLQMLVAARCCAKPPSDGNVAARLTRRDLA